TNEEEYIEESKKEGARHTVGWLGLPFAFASFIVFYANCISQQRRTRESKSSGSLVLSHFEFEGFRTVMPAQAGIQGEQAAASGYSAWIPAFAGMTQHSSPPQNHHDRLLAPVAPNKFSLG